MPRRPAAGLGVLLGLSLLLVYNANFREIGFGDSVPTMLLPASILKQGNLDLNEYRIFLWITPNPAFWMNAVQDQNGHLVSSYPVGAALLAVPVYAPFALGRPFNKWNQFRLVSKLAASLFVALSAVCLFGVTRRFVGPRGAALLTVAYGLGTTAWPGASQALWQHGPGMLCLAVAVWLLARLDEERPPPWLGVAAGLALGFAVATRTLNLPPALMLLAYALHVRPRQACGLAAALGAMLGWIAWYNWTTFHNLRGGYEAIFNSIALANLHIQPGDEFSHPLLPGLAGILVSPSRGLLVFSPFLAFAVPGALHAWCPGGWRLARYLTVWVAVMTLVYAKYIMWWGGGAYGPRLLSETLIPLVVLVAYGWPLWSPSRTWRAVFGVAVAVAICLQGIGAFYAPCGWDDHPVRVDLHPERLWNWRDPEPLRCLLAGPRPFEFLAAAPRPREGTGPTRPTAGH